MADMKATFSGSIPEYYDKYLGPATFDAFAEVLVERLPAEPAGDVLELACGTGIVTKRLRDRLDPAVKLVATDLSKAMLDYARAKLGEGANVEWREADMGKLPFGDGEFGAVACAFGFMFVPDKPAAFSEAFRVLKDGGTLAFSVWDRIEESPHAAINARIVEGLFPGDAEIKFRIPYELGDAALLRKLVMDAGFRDAQIDKKQLPLGPVSARGLATGQCRGTPRYLLIEKRGVSVDDVIDKVAAELARTGGADPYRGVAQAFIVQTRR